MTVYNIIVVHNTAVNSSDNLHSSSRQSSQLRWRLLEWRGMQLISWLLWLNDTISDISYSKLSEEVNRKYYQDGTTFNLLHQLWAPQCTASQIDGLPPGVRLWWSPDEFCQHANVWGAMIFKPFWWQKFLCHRRPRLWNVLPCQFWLLRVTFKYSLL